MHESILIEEPQASVARHSKASVHLAVETGDVGKRLSPTSQLQPRRGSGGAGVTRRCEATAM